MKVERVNLNSIDFMPFPAREARGFTYGFYPKHRMLECEFVIAQVLALARTINSKVSGFIFNPP